MSGDVAPMSDSWAPRLHRAVSTAPIDHPDLGFLASLLAHALKHGELTDRQALYAERALQKQAEQVRDGAV